MTAEILSRCHAEANRYQRQAAMEPGKPFVRDEPGRIDQDVAVIEQRLQDVREDVERGTIRDPPIGSDVQPQRGGQLTVDVQTYQVGVVGFIVIVGKPPRRVFGNSAFASIGLVAEAKYCFTLSVGLCTPELDSGRQLRKPSRKAALRTCMSRVGQLRLTRSFCYWTHHDPLGTIGTSSK